MAFEAFSVILSPINAEDERMAAGYLVAQMKRRWRGLETDTLELAGRAFTRPHGEIFLARSMAVGLIQLAVWREKSSCAVQIELRFAYCNTHSIYEPFCEMTAWLMRRYQLRCHIVPDLAPEQQGVSDDFDDPDKTREILTPSMDYNHQLWQEDAGTDATAVLRPGDALAKFIAPRLLHASL